MTDIEIARSARMRPISEIAGSLGLREEDWEPYGRYKAKVSVKNIDRLANRPDGKLILVTAISPTPAGEGKTTMSVGLGDALHQLGKRTVLALREPSLGPVFGVKGGAAGGGHAQVVPMEDLNLHFTGDLHAITAANNLIAAMLDNHIYQGNALSIDPQQVLWKRCLDMNDRQLRRIESGLGGKTGGIPREDGFQITAASEMMAIFCLSRDLADLKARVNRILVAYDTQGRPVTAGQLGATGAVAALLRDALAPNLVQTLEHTPVLIHGGPFANIAHGCNSIIATRLALKLGDYVVTEAGFGADLGAEKFLDIKCRVAGLKPSACVVVATIRALKHHAGVAKEKLGIPDCAALMAGLPNLFKHVDNMRAAGLPVVVAVNRFPTDAEEEIACLVDACAQHGVQAHLVTAWADGGKGGLELASTVMDLCQREPQPPRFFYDTSMTVREKVEAVAKQVYGAAAVQFSAKALASMERISQMGLDKLLICIAKTQYSLSDDPKKLGAPTDFTIKVRDVVPSCGAGFLVIHTGTILTMPGLPKVPAAESIDVLENGEMVGLF